MPSHFRVNGLGHAGKAVTMEGEGDKLRAKFSIAVSDGKDKPASWYYITAWGKTAERCAGIRSGDLVQVEGRGKMDEYTTKDGVKKNEFRVTAERVVNFSDWRRAKDEKDGAPAAPAKPEPPDDDVPF